MDIRNMRQVLAIRTHGSFAKAAAMLGMSQPSLSTAIARLEDQLGARLFERAPSGSELTPIGMFIADRAGKIVAETESIVRDAELVACGDTGTVRIGVGTALKPHFLRNYVRTIATRHPALQLHIEVLDRDKLLPLLRARELDLIVCGVGEEVVDEGLVVAPVMTAAAVAVASPTHPLAAEWAISVARFTEFPAAGAKTLHYSNVDILDVSDVGADISRYTANDYEPLLELAKSGVCTLIAPAHVVRPEVGAGALVILDLDWRLTVRFAAITTRAANYSPIVSRLLAYAGEVGTRLQD